MKTCLQKFLCLSVLTLCVHALVTGTLSASESVRYQCAGKEQAQYPETTKDIVECDSVKRGNSELPAQQFPNLGTTSGGPSAE